MDQIGQMDQIEMRAMTEELTMIRLTRQKLLGAALAACAGIALGAFAVSSLAAPKLKPRIIQTNFAGDSVSVIDPVTNKVVGHIEGIELNHGVAVNPNGKWIYISDETNQTLDVADGKSLKVVNRIVLHAHPNNITISHDGRRVYVAIVGKDGGIDVIDTVAQKEVTFVPTHNAIHNPYVTPDGKYVLAGSIQGKMISVIDTQTNEVAFTIPMDLGVRPMAISANPDGSTQFIFAQLTGFNGFAVIDFATRKEIKRLKNPDLPADRKAVPPGNEASHGIAVTADQKTLLVASRVNTALYSYSIPDFKLLGTAYLGGKGAGWLTLSPDSKTAYVANPIDDDVSAVDVASMKEIALIPVGSSPKRNTSGMLE
jgi:YVTN family beta-propeller protein